MNRKSRKILFLKNAVYWKRHIEDNRDFLILANGQSVVECKANIISFIQQTRPISIGCNFLNNMFVPDYHMFVNRRRFCDYYTSVAQESILLLSPYISRRIVSEKIGLRYYEEIMFRNKYPSEKGSLKIKKGRIYCQGGTVATIACGVALCMGAKNIYIAGLDGYSLYQSRFHFYDEKDENEREHLEMTEKCTNEILRNVNALLMDHGGTLKIITPTVYEEYHESLF